MKKILTLIFVLLCVFILGSCENNSQPQEGLEAPNINIEDCTIKWNKIDGAEEYIIYINNTQYARITDNYYQLILNPGTYKVFVSARKGEEFSPFSNKITYVQEAIGEDIKLETPVITISNNVVKWQAIPYASQYEIYDNGELYKLTINTSFTLYFDNGLHVITVKATSNVENIIDSDLSNEVSFIPTIQTGTGELAIFEINDTHGAFVTDNDFPGMEKVSTVIKDLNKSDLLKIANGDIFQGGYVSNATYGRCFIDALNYLNFDAFVIGNHEFDWGLNKLAEYKDGDLTNGEASFPFLGANIVNKNTGERPEWLDDYMITECNGLKVGVIGTIGESLTGSIAASKVEDYTFLDPVPVVEKIAKELRTIYNCDVVVVSEHDYNQNTNNRYASLAGDSHIDAIVCGHTHKKISEKIKGSTGAEVPVIESASNNKCVGMIELNLDKGYVTDSFITHYNPANYTSDEGMNDVIKQYQAIIDEGNTVVGTAYGNLSRYKMGTIATNSLRDYFKVNFGLVNRAGVRSSVDKGNVCVKDIYRVFPFDNEIYLVTIKGSALQYMFEESGSYLYFSDNFNSNNLDSSKDYVIAVIDYVYNNALNKKYFKNTKCEKTNVYIREIVTRFFKGTLNE